MENRQEKQLGEINVVVPSGTDCARRHQRRRGRELAGPARILL